MSTQMHMYLPMPNGVQEVERLSEQRDIMMQKAQGSEAALDSERQVWSSSHATVGMAGTTVGPRGTTTSALNPLPQAFLIVGRKKNSGTKD